MILAVIQSSVILFISLCSARLLRRQSAATRHAVLTVSLISSLAVPFVGALLPEFQLVRSPGLYARVQEQAEILWSSEADIKPAPTSLSTPVPAPSHSFL